MSIELKNKPCLRIDGWVIDCGVGEAGAMATFYCNLFGWKQVHPAPDGWAAIASPDGFTIAFQEIEEYEPPVWPWQSGKQAQMIHFDLKVENLEDAVQFAVNCGSKIADVQYYETGKTMLDPAGHPFCLYKSAQ